MKTRIYKTRAYDRAMWCLRWQTPIMPVPAFWYYDTRLDAELALLKIINPKLHGGS